MGVETIKDLIDAGAAPEVIYQALCQQERYDVLEVAYIAGIKIAAVNPPANKDVPYVEQVDDNLTCTMGNWTGEPTTYAYAWNVDGAAAGTDKASYAVRTDDADKVAYCTVSATNPIGTTVAPPSNSVTITAPATRAKGKKDYS